jgi:hypothetical protein
VLLLQGFAEQLFARLFLPSLLISVCKTWLLLLLLLQGFAERLFTRLQGSRERWETRLDMMTVVSRCAAGREGATLWGLQWCWTCASALFVLPQLLLSQNAKCLQPVPQLNLLDLPSNGATA